MSLPEGFINPVYDNENKIEQNVNKPDVINNLNPNGFVQPQNISQNSNGFTQPQNINQNSPITS